MTRRKAGYVYRDKKQEGFAKAQSRSYAQRNKERRCTKVTHMS